jgi:hypothetical protein
MLHFVPESLPEEGPAPYAEAVARLAGIRHALRLVDPFGGGPASDPAEDEHIGDVWESAGAATRRCFDKRTNATAGAAAAGLEALLEERAEGRTPNAAASHELSEEIRLGLEEVSRLMLRR